MKFKFLAYYDIFELTPNIFISWSGKKYILFSWAFWGIQLTLSK